MASPGQQSGYVPAEIPEEISARKIVLRMNCVTGLRGLSLCLSGSLVCKTLQVGTLGGKVKHGYSTCLRLIGIALSPDPGGVQKAKRTTGDIQPINLVTSSEIKFRSRPVRHLVAPVHKPLVVELLENPPHGLHKPHVQCLVIVLHITSKLLLHYMVTCCLS